MSVVITWRERAVSWTLSKIVGAYVFVQMYRAARLQRIGKWFWSCYRDGGGGVIQTPRPMKELQAIRWLRETADAEVFYIDRAHFFLFYRPRGH